MPFLAEIISSINNLPKRSMAMNMVKDKIATLSMRAKDMTGLE